MEPGYVTRAVKALIVAYLTSWNPVPTETLPAKCLTHINYAFANIKDGVIVPGNIKTDHQDRIPNPNWKPGSTVPSSFNGYIDELTNPQGPVSLCNPDLKKLISIGGWDNSKDFSTVASTPESREKFAISVVQYIADYGFNGCDVNWIYPQGDGKPGNVVSPNDPQNFALLLEEIREEMDKYAEEHGTDRMLLTASTAATKARTEKLDLAGIADDLDFYNIMIYDFAGSWDKVTGHNAPFQPAFVDSVNNYLNRNVTPDKLVPGVPLYGKQFLGAPVKGAGSTFKTVNPPMGYDVIKDNLTSDKGYTVEWDDKAQAGYLWNDELKEFVTYEHPNSSLIKATFANDNELGGMYVWELSFDRYADILRTIVPKLLGSVGLQDNDYREECFCE